MITAAARSPDGNAGRVVSAKYVLVDATLPPMRFRGP